MKAHAPLIFLAFLLTALGLTCFSQASFARDQWQMHYQDDMQPPPPAQTNANYVPAGQAVLTPDFWRTQMMGRLPAGTVLSAILEDDLSSNQTQVGTIFSLRLQDGFEMNGQEVIPKNSKIVGTVTGALPAAVMHGGQPGQLTVSLQTLVLPNGRNIRFFGFIEHNPDQDQKQESPEMNHLKNTAGTAEHAVTGFVQMLTSRVGLSAFTPRPNMNHAAHDLRMHKGEVLPVRLNRSLVIQPDAGAVGNLNYTMPPTATNMNKQAPTPVSMSTVPGLAGPDPDATPLSQLSQLGRMAAPPTPPQGSAGLASPTDPF